MAFVAKPAAVILTVLLCCPATALAAGHGSILNDGFAGAPNAVVQHPTALNGYAKRPPWHVAGIDYAVGYPTSTTLVKWSANFTGTTAGSTWTGGAAGCSSGADPNVTVTTETIDARTSLGIQVAAAATITCFDSMDFSQTVAGGANTGVSLSIQKSNFTISNSKFGNTVSSCCIISQNTGATGINFHNNIIDMGIGSPPNMPSTFTNGMFGMASGASTYQYNWLKNYPFGGPANYGQNSSPTKMDYRFNLTENGATNRNGHLNYLNGSGGANFDYSLVQFNTIIQNVGIAGGEGYQVYNNTAGTFIINPEIAYNTMIFLNTPISSTNWLANHTYNYGDIINGTGGGVTGGAAYYAAMQNDNVNGICSVTPFTRNGTPQQNGNPQTGVSGSSAPNLSGTFGDQTAVDNTVCWVGRDAKSVSAMFHGPFDDFPTGIWGNGKLHDNYIDTSGMIAKFHNSKGFDGFAINNNWIMDGSPFTYP